MEQPAMKKFEDRADPLKAKASRIEKPRRAKRGFLDPPSWLSQRGLQPGSEREEISVDSIANGSFILYRSDKVEKRQRSLYRTLDIFASDESNFAGMFLLNWWEGPRFGFPRFPKFLRTGEIIDVKSRNGKYQLSLQFFSNRYMKLRVVRDPAFVDKASPWSSPTNHFAAYEDPPCDLYEFVGVCYAEVNDRPEQRQMGEDERSGALKKWQPPRIDKTGRF